LQTLANPYLHLTNGFGVMQESKTLNHILAQEAQAFLFKNAETQSETDRLIWIAFKQGNRSAFDHIFLKYSRLLYAYGVRFTKDKQLIEDCIQDMFVELWHRRENVSETTSIKFYLLKSLRRRIVRSLSQSKAAEKRSWEYINDEDNVDFSCELIWISEEMDLARKKQLQDAVAQLSTRQKEAVYLRYYEMMSYEAIALVMEITVASAYTLIGRAIADLRKFVSLS
jgi:RNA polymerase sigma factor (sigma-70 family)